jgi:NADPH:quinone reductase-like Zn-dependent oxidoreductase
MALGYSNAGEVIAVGKDVDTFKIGDRVACCGGGFASHAELVRIPRNLAAKIPSRADRTEVSYEDAAFATVAAIALQGLRLAELQLGEVVVVLGLGLIGQIAVQLARSAGCIVLGMDPNAQRCQLAERLGCAAAAESADALESHIRAPPEPTSC